MASRLILKDIKAPMHFLLRNRASSASLLAQTIQNHIVHIPTQFAAESSKFGIVVDRTPLSRDLMAGFDGGFRIEVRGKQPERDRFEDDDEMEEISGSDLEDSDEFSGDSGEESGGDFYDDDDIVPRDDEV